jgi:hypothetical protein
MFLRSCSFVAPIVAAAVIVACQSRSQPASPSLLENVPSMLEHAPADVVAPPMQTAAKGPSRHDVTLFDCVRPGDLQCRTR